jgi:hypothetical protein
MQWFDSEHNCGSGAARTEGRGPRSFFSGGGDSGWNIQGSIAWDTRTPVKGWRHSCLEGRGRRKRRNESGLFRRDNLNHGLGWELEWHRRRVSTGINLGFVDLSHHESSFQQCPVDVWGCRKGDLHCFCVDIGKASI